MGWTYAEAKASAWLATSRRGVWGGGGWKLEPGGQPGGSARAVFFSAKTRQRVKGLAAERWGVGRLVDSECTVPLLLPLLLLLLMLLLLARIPGRIFFF